MREERGNLIAGYALKFLLPGIVIIESKTQILRLNGVAFIVNKLQAHLNSLININKMFTPSAAIADIFIILSGSFLSPPLTPMP